MLTNKTAGLSIIEVIISIAILVIIASSSVVAILGSFSSARLGKEETQAANLASQAIEAVTAIKNQAWANLSAGTFGLSNTAGPWAFAGVSDTIGKFTRSVTVSAVERDVNGDIVSTGGTVDSNSFLITANVSWDFTPTRNNTVTITSLVTNWLTGQNGGGSGGGGGGGGTEASSLAVNISAPVLTNGGTRLTGLTVENTSAVPITITFVTPTWTNASLIRDFQIGGGDVWDRNGPGLPSGSQPSGTVLDIQDFVLAANSGPVAIDRLRFTSSVTGTTVGIVFTMSDGSTLPIAGIAL